MEQTQKAKVRLLVMNGQKVTQGYIEGEWAVLRVEKSKGITPGIYNLYSAKEADTSKPHVGVIIHADDKGIYQSCGKSIIFHDRAKFDIMTNIGTNYTISYGSKGATQVEEAKAKRGRGRSM